MDYDPGPFMTSVLELKLDATTTFEWQKHSQAQSKVPHYQDLLDFINLRAQASESPSQQHLKRTNKADTKRFPKVTTYAASYESGAKCISCKSENHPLYVCPTFRAMSHDNKIALLKEKKLCMNCLNGGHFIKSCKSIHRCKRCQRSHHTLLHVADSASATTSLPHSDTIPAPFEVKYSSNDM